jgi:dTDP-4-amino-4,6-dideoxygalactose transaminase
MIFTALSPNTQRDDYRLAKGLILRSSQYYDGGYTRRVKQWFKDYLGVKYVSAYESARTAMYFILKELGVGEGDEVLVQSFTCVAASNPIIWIKAKPVFVDVEPGFFNADPEAIANNINENVKAIIVQHTFGYPAKIEEIKRMADERGIYVIEDCTHSIGTELDGKKLGTLCDAAIFSFGRDKAISASFGGVAVTNRDKLGLQLEEGETFLSFPSKKWIRSQVLYTIVSYLTRTYYERMSLGKLIHFLATKLKLVHKSTSWGEKKEASLPTHAKSKLPNILARLALNQLEKVDSINKRRQELMHLYLKRFEKLNINGVVLPSWKLRKNLFPLRIPLLVKDRDRLVEYAKEKGVLLGKWYDTPIAPKEVDLVKTGYKRGSCPNTEKACERIVNLPLHINMTDDDVLQVVAVIRDFYK